MIPALLLLACMGEDRFQARYDEEICAWRRDCFGDDFEACLDAAADAWDGSGCDFHRHEARRCLKELRYMDCPAEGDPGLPPECAEVWTCP